MAQLVARMERSVIREPAVPHCASLHAGYELLRGVREQRHHIKDGLALAPGHLLGLKPPALGPAPDVDPDHPQLPGSPWMSSKKTSCQAVGLAGIMPTRLM